MRCYALTGHKVALPSFGGLQSRSKNMFDVLLLMIKLQFGKHRCPTLNGYLLITKSRAPPPTIHCPSSLWFLTAPFFFKSRRGHVPVTSYRRTHFSLLAAQIRNEHTTGQSAASSWGTDLFVCLFFLWILLFVILNLATSCPWVRGCGASPPLPRPDPWSKDIHKETQSTGRSICGTRH